MPPNRGASAALSDAQGHFSFQELAPGLYLSRAQAIGFVLKSGPLLKLDAAQVLKDIEIKLFPQAVIGDIGRRHFEGVSSLVP